MAVSILKSHADTLTIAMVGDIMMGTTFPSVMLPNNNGADLFKDAKVILKKADTPGFKYRLFSLCFV